MTHFPFIKLVFSGSGREGVCSCVDAFRHAYFWPFGGLPGVCIFCVRARKRKRACILKYVCVCEYLVHDLRACMHTSRGCIGVIVSPRAHCPLPGRHNFDHSLLGTCFPIKYPTPAGILDRLQPTTVKMCSESYTAERHRVLMSLRSNANRVEEGYVPQSLTGALSSQPPTFTESQPPGSPSSSTWRS